MDNYISSRKRRLSIGVSGYTDNTTVLDAIGNLVIDGNVESKVLISNVSTGTSPLTITSTTKVSNLNVDRLDDQEGTYYLDLNNSTGTLATTKGGTGLSTYTIGDILYSSAANTLSKLPIGSNNQILSISSGVPAWKSLVASDIGAITGIDIEEDSTNLGTKTTVSFGSGLTAITDPSDSSRAIVSLSLSASDVGIDIQEEGGTSLGKATTLNFVGRATTATFNALSSTATLTLSDDPIFNTITSDVATGTAPLVVTSTTLVANLNADKLDSQEGSYYLDLGNATGILATTKGGTGLSTYTTGDILYSSATNTLSKLTIGSPSQILSVSASGIPEWINPTVAGINILEEGNPVGSATSVDFVGRAITATFATSTATITLSDTPTFSTITSDVVTGTAPLTVTSTTKVVNLNVDKLDDQEGTYYLDLANATGSLGETKGGTGQTTYTTGDILYSSTTNTLSKLTIGSTDQVLTVDASGIPAWKTASAGEQDVFNTSLTHTVLASLTGVGGAVLTLPSTAGRQYIIHSIHAANTEPGNDEVNVVGSFDFNNGDRSYFAYSLPIPTGTGIELLIKPQVLGPSDSIAMRSLDLNRNGADDYVEVYITYQEVTSAEYIGVGYGQDLGTGDYGIPTTASTTIYTSSTYPSVINSIRLTNRTDTGGYPISVSITSGANTIRLVDNLIIPKYGSVELLETPKRLSMNDTINVQVDQVGTIDVQVSGQQIV